MAGTEPENRRADPPAGAPKQVESRDDDALVALAIGGDEAALGLLLERHGPTVRARILPAMPKRWQAVLSADDVLQQAYTDAFLHIRAFVPYGSGAFTAWLTRLAKNALNDAVDMLSAIKRGGDRQRLVPDPDHSLSSLINSVRSVTGGTPSGAVANDEALAAVRAALQRLAPRHRLVLEMFDLQQRPIEEVARTIERSVGAAYMLRARALRQLAEIMGNRSLYLSR